MHTYKKALLGSIVVLGALLGGSVALASTALSVLPSGVGNYNQFTTTGTSTHYLNVDETTCNGLTDYNQTSKVANRDSYAVSLSGVPDGAVISSIAIIPCAGRAAIGGVNPVMNVFYRSNGVNSADAGAYSINLAVPGTLATTTYSGLSIVKNASSTLEVGAVLTSGTKGIRLSRIAAIVTYETVPAAPSNLTGTVSTTSAVQLNWNDNSSDETSFKIERATSSFVFSQIASTTMNVTTYSDPGLPSGTYFYRVRAANTAGNSGYSNIATTTVP